MEKKYYGLHVGWHDASVTILNENGELEFYAQSERFCPRAKLHEYLTNILDLYRKPTKDDVVCIDAYEPNIENIENINPHLAKKFHFQEHIRQRINNYAGYPLEPTIAVSHHLCHILSSWFFRENDERRFVLGYDGAGSYATGEASTCIGGFIDEQNFELIELREAIPTGNVVACLLGLNGAGKAMGLAGYLKTKKEKNFSERDMKIFIESIFYRKPGELFWPDLTFQQQTPEILDFAARLYDFWTDEIWRVIEKNLNIFLPNKDLGIVLGGGTTLALELNTKIEAKVKNVVFGPPANDSGISLGAASYGFFIENKKWPMPLKSPSIMYLQKENPVVGFQEPKEIAQLIANDKVIGLLRGKAECGPRALGFRSIFANACKLSNLRRVSEDLKGREFYRPLAPIVTSEQFDRYFIGPKGEYMQYKCDCTEDAQKELPAIVHRDNSARPQVVYKEKDPWLHELLVEYGNLTGHECFINTSLNGKRKPICNTYEDALEDFQDKDIEIISIPE